GGHDTEEGTLLVAHAGESQFNGHWKTPVGSSSCCSKTRGKPCDLHDVGRKLATSLSAGE
ncbi:hypothetical protein, partial [uncultured Bilophila sp.]|uniref:hypothetical protein n=1 Tax=uncultured Bilophila sp. TaxID=529385 RepID=UPI0026372D45